MRQPGKYRVGEESPSEPRQVLRIREYILRGSITSDKTQSIDVEFNWWLNWFYPGIILSRTSSLGITFTALRRIYPWREFSVFLQSIVTCKIYKFLYTAIVRKPAIYHIWSRWAYIIYSWFTILNLIHWFISRQDKVTARKKIWWSVLPSGENSLTNKFIFTSDLMNLGTESTIGIKIALNGRWPFKWKCLCQNENNGKINNKNVIGVLPAILVLTMRQ